jgi:hypothetical protein
MCKGRPQSKVDVTCRCISQKDVQERTEQVQLMGRIYERCYEGIVYLGDQLENRAPPVDPPPVLHLDRDEPLPGGVLNSNAKSYSYRMPAIHRVFTIFRDLSRSQHLYEIPVFGGIWWEKSWSDLKKGNKNRLELFEALRRFMQPPFTPCLIESGLYRRSQLPATSLLYTVPYLRRGPCLRRPRPNTRSTAQPAVRI